MERYKLKAVHKKSKQSVVLIYTVFFLINKKTASEKVLFIFGCSPSII